MLYRIKHDNFKTKMGMLVKTIVIVVLNDVISFIGCPTVNVVNKQLT